MNAFACGEDAVRVLGTLIVIILCALPAVFAGRPGIAPAWFDQSWRGAPLSVLAMCGLMLAFIVLAGLCSLAARGADSRRGGE